MSTALEAASLIMVPSGYDNGVLGSVKPIGGAGNFTFSRGSDISATRVNEDGYIEKGYENLLYPSNDFSVWNKTRTSVTSGQAGYDGSNDAWLLEAIVTSQCWISKSHSATGICSLSVYAKANTATGILVAVGGTLGTGYARFDLTNGVTGSVVGNGVASSIESVGDGWYRCSMFTTNTTITLPYIYVIDDVSTSNVTAGNSIYIQDAQINQGLVAYPYVETTTAPVAGGILEDMPRIDHSNGKPSLLLEPQRTNLTTNSEYAIVTNGGITYNDATSPEGVQNALKITATSAAFPRFLSTTTLGGGNTYIVSFYAKKGVGDGVGLYGYSSVNYNNVVRFNLDTNEVTYLQTAFSDGYIEDAGNGWKRCVAKLTTPATGSWSGINAVINKSNFLQAEIGDEHYFYGMQVEQDATYPTSYIPTYGTSQTRLRDNVNRLDISSLAATYQTLFIETSVFLVSTTQYKFSINDATGSRTNRFTILINNDDLLLLVNSQGSAQPSITQSDYISANTTYKIAAVVRDGSYALFANGTKIGEQVGTTPSNLNSLTFGDASNPLNQNWEGSVNQALIFPTALSDDECIALTTI